MMIEGWKILKVDLASGKVERDVLEAESLQRFIGGRGLGAAVLAPYAVEGVDPLDGSVPLILATGPLTGAGIPSGDRFSLSTISPLTGTVMDTNSGGRLGRSLRRAGIDLVVVEGTSPSPAILVVDDGEVRLEPASDLWGCTVSETLTRLKERLSETAGMSVIGPAGENGVRYASIMTERMRAMGR
ncbi:MAG: aldehyde ferredoxin oxidoreductase, partial [bacterium]